MKQVMDGIVAIEKNDVNLSNANMSAHTPAGQMMTFASEVTKDYANKYLLGVKYARAHRNGDIHIHDLDYYPTKTTTCIQYDLDDLFERGFRTRNRVFVRLSQFRVMPHWQPSYFRQTKTNSMEGNPFLRSTFLWQRAFERLS